MLKLVIDNTKPLPVAEVSVAYQIGDVVQLECEGKPVNGIISMILPQVPEPIFKVHGRWNGMDVKIECTREDIINNITAQMREGGEM